MDYLKNTVVFLEEENRDLKQKIKRMQELQNIINQQRGQQQKEYLIRLHQEEINVIREMADSTQSSLKKEIRSLKLEVQELTQTLMGEENEKMNIKRELQRVRNQIENLTTQKLGVESQINLLADQLNKVNMECVKKVEEVEGQFKQRQQQIMEKYMKKIQELSDKHDDELIIKERVIVSQNRKIELVLQEKQMFEDQLERMMKTLKNQESTTLKKTKSNQQSLQKLHKDNEKLSSAINNLQIELYQVKQRLQEELRKGNVLEQQKNLLKKKYSELEQIRKRELQKQKSKILSVSKDLAEHKKYLKGQMQTSKRREKEHNHSTKVLIGKIKEMEGKSDHSKSNNTSFNDKTVAKTSKKTNFQTYQSVSLDNSLNRDSPSVSCFLRESKLDGKVQLKKKPLTIDTNSHQTLLRFQNVQTPCFQSTKESNKKTIKIKK